jgi:NADPH-dependent 2,4-dienoyl-CoA reductase/sulfur reductase-like enzyme
LVTRDEVPYEKILGKEIGQMVNNEHTKNGVIMHPKNTVTEINGENGKVKSVLLSDGTLISADVVLYGAGITPATNFLNGSSIKLD